ANALVVERQATLERSEHDFKRAAELVDRGAVSRADYDLARAARDEADARLRNAQQALRLAELGPRQEDKDAARAQLDAQEASIVQSERRLADCELIAPSTGVILTRAREQGAIVQPGETIFALTLSSPVWVRTYVNETDLGRIRPEMLAEVRTDSAPDKIHRGKIGFISPTAEFTPKTVETRELRTDLVYRLRVVVDNPDGGLRQGMPVTVTLDLTGEAGYR
ncbi:MAG TPA: efflux RND transporter periplasmic adaptor subunit, partial [Pirellulales bacterium]|nr:efflux RND transporter periplasmic adaptor subunit [Pirellulales bacterium]